VVSLASIEVTKSEAICMRERDLRSPAVSDHDVTRRHVRALEHHDSVARSRQGACPGLVAL
jgi:hypothetical protein